MQGGIVGGYHGPPVPPLVPLAVPPVPTVQEHVDQETNELEATTSLGIEALTGEAAFDGRSRSCRVPLCSVMTVYGRARSRKRVCAVYGRARSRKRG